MQRGEKEGEGAESAHEQQEASPAPHEQLGASSGAQNFSTGQPWQEPGAGGGGGQRPYRSLVACHVGGKRSSGEGVAHGCDGRLAARRGRGGAGGRPIDPTTYGAVPKGRVHNTAITRHGAGRVRAGHHWLAARALATEGHRALPEHTGSCVNTNHSQSRHLCCKRRRHGGRVEAACERRLDFGRKLRSLSACRGQAAEEGRPWGRSGWPRGFALHHMRSRHGNSMAGTGRRRPCAEGQQ